MSETTLTSMKFRLNSRPKRDKLASLIASRLGTPVYVPKDSNDLTLNPSLTESPIATIILARELALKVVSGEEGAEL